MPFFAQQAPVEGYDRLAASRLLAELAFPGLFPSPDSPVSPDGRARSTPPPSVPPGRSSTVPRPWSPNREAT